MNMNFRAPHSNMKRCRPLRACYVRQTNKFENTTLESKYGEGEERERWLLVAVKYSKIDSKGKQGSSM